MSHLLLDAGQIWLLNLAIVLPAYVALAVGLWLLLWVLLRAIVPRARSSIGCATSTSFTENPDCANTCAMPLPIVPAPITPIVLMSIDEKRFSRSHEGHEVTGPERKKIFVFFVPS